MPLTFHFLNVGHGDCTIIEHPDGCLSVIDINNGNEIDNDLFTEIHSELQPCAAGIERTANTQQPVGQGLLALFMDRNGLERGLKSEKGLPGLGLQRNRSIADYSQPSFFKRLQNEGYHIGLTNPIEYLQNTFQTNDIHRYIQTHPDLDHMRGLHALINSRFSILNFWDTNHTKTPELLDKDKDDWQAYLELKRSSQTPTVLNPMRGSVGRYFSKGEFGDERGHGIEILSPTAELVKLANENSNWNELSYVLRINYAGRSVILGGDAEQHAWENIYAYYGAHLSCDVLKASHHGRRTGYHQTAVAAMRPDLTIVSVGKKPGTDASNCYRRYSNQVWSTRWRGTIRVTIYENGAMNYLSDY